MTNQFAHPADLSPSKPAALHVDKAMLDLIDAVAANAEAIQSLLSRLGPLLSKPSIIVGSISIADISGAQISSIISLSAGKAPLASAIEERVAKIEAVTKEVNDAIAALQI